MDDSRARRTNHRTPVETAGQGEHASLLRRALSETSVLLLATACAAFALAAIGCGGGEQNDAESGEVREETGAEIDARETDPEGGATNGGAETADEFVSGMQVDSLIREGERHFAHLYQLTNGGENAEAYWSFDGEELIFQATTRETECDQIYIIPATGGQPRLVSTGKGRTTCAYFFPRDERILFSSTHLGNEECPPTPDYSMGYVWPIYDTYDIFTAKPDGSDLQQLTTDPRYDAEATVGPDGSIVFTSTRDGDLEIYRMDADGSNVQRLTEEPGYDGGAFFSPDGSMICFRASRPTGGDLADYQNLLRQGLIRPGQLDIYVMNADGSDVRRLTDNGAANFCPFFHPSGEKIIFASNLDDPQGRNFDLYLINLDGSGLERVTYEGSFDGFPMFSPDGTRLAFSSNRNAEREGETNVFVAEWRNAP